MTFSTILSIKLLRLLNIADFSGLMIGCAIVFIKKKKLNIIKSAPC